MTKRIIKRKPHETFCKELLEPVVRKPRPLAPLYNPGAAYDKLYAKYVEATMQWAEALKQEDDIMERKLLLLLKHYNLPADDPKSWRMLSLRLAKDYIPGFQIMTKANSGRPPIWDSDDLLDLYVAVENKKKEAKAAGRTTTIENICSHLIKEAPWKFIEKCTEKTLYHRYAASKKDPLVKLLLEKDKKEPGYLIGYWMLEFQPHTGNSS